MRPGHTRSADGQISPRGARLNKTVSSVRRTARLSRDWRSRRLLRLAFSTQRCASSVEQRRIEHRGAMGQ